MRTINDKLVQIHTMHTIMINTIYTKAIHTHLYILMLVPSTCMYLYLVVCSYMNVHTHTYTNIQHRLGLTHTYTCTDMNSHTYTYIHMYIPFKQGRMGVCSEGSGRSRPMELCRTTRSSWMRLATVCTSHMGDPKLALPTPPLSDACCAPKRIWWYCTIIFQKSCLT